MNRAILANALRPLIQEATALRDDVQWMPPGRQSIRPHVAGEAKEVELDVNEALAQKVIAQFGEMEQRARQGIGDIPYFDFNHHDAEAAGHVTQITWAGQDPSSGGIRAKVQWTAAGKQALEGRSYRRFSPTWFVNKDTGAFEGIGVNMGGLVNRAAFETIQAIVAQQPQQPSENDMTPEQITQAVKTALAPIEDRLKAVEARAPAVTETQAADTIVEAKKFTELETRLKSLEGSTTANATAQAKAAVAVHARRGAFPPQNADVLGMYEEQYRTNPERTEKILASLPSNPAFAGQYTQGNSEATNAAAAGVETAEGFVAGIQAAMAKDPKLAKTQALNHAVETNAKGFAAWRAANGKPAL